MSEVRVEREGHVALVVLDAPPNNHVSVDNAKAIADAFEAADADASVRALVLASEGRVFCGGADLSAPRGLAEGRPATISPLYDQAARLFSNTKPVVAAVQGAAVGAGLGLALVADFRVAGPEARFSANFVKLGFHAGFGISHTLPRVVGLQRAALMLQTARRLKPDEAHAFGLVDELATAGEVRAAAMRLAQELAENAPLAVQSTRATLRRGLVEAVREATRHELAEQTRLMATGDFREGLRAVAERRAGAFTGA